MFSSLKADFQACFERDPAARTAVEVLLTYPGLHAIIMHRLAHFLHTSLNLKFLARVFSALNRFLTGIEIHPAAKIGEGFFIDHGMGVVIGETAEVGQDVTLFQGVTLGGTGKERGKRHPTLEDQVVVGANASILGAITIGEGSRVGSGSVLVQSVPPHSTVVGVPGRVVRKEGEKIPSVSLDHSDIPDPLVESVQKLQQRIEELERKVDEEPEDDA